MVDLTNTPDCRMSEKLSLIRSFSKYSPHSKASNTSANVSNLPFVKVEEPSKISGTVLKRTLEEEQLNYQNKSNYIQTEANTTKMTQSLALPEEHEAPHKLQNEDDIGLDPAEKLQNEIRTEREKEAAEWNKAKARAMLSNHKNKKQIVFLERQLQKINQLLSFNYFEKAKINRKVTTLASLNFFLEVFR